MASNATQLGLGVLAAGAIAVTGVILAPRINGTSNDAPAPEAAAAVEVPIESVSEEEAAATPDPAPQQEEVAAAPQRPTLDSFYMQPDGFATIAGRAEAGQAVAIMVAGDRVADLEADGSGAFAAAILLDLSDEPRRLIALADPDGSAIASASIMVAPTPKSAAPVLSDEPVIVGAVTALSDADVPEELAATETDPSTEEDTPVEQAAAETETKEEVAAAAPESATEDSAAVEQAATDADAPAEIAMVTDTDPLIEDSTAEEPATTEFQPTPETPAAEVPSNTTAEEEAPLVASNDASVEDPTPETAEVETPVESLFTDPVEATPPVETSPVITAEAATTTQPDTEETVTEVAPTVIIAETEGVRVLQDAGPRVLSSIALDTITYDPSGEVVLGGRATGEGFVQVYINNKPVRTTQIEAGDWHADLPNVESGVYTLRLDEVDEAGTVISRIETPFKREEPAAVAAVMAEDTARPGFDVAVRTVQPGATLWAIAQEELGEGIMYVAVFEANRDLIRDPDLIYPGQVFRIPEMPVEN